MKTNANPKTIVKAVENVSAMYGKNIVFRKSPEKLTKNVIRFTLRTKDSSKPGSSKLNGHMQPKANWEVHEKLIAEIFKLDPRASVYIDSIKGRHYNPNPVAVAEPVARVKRKYTKRNIRKYMGRGTRRYTRKGDEKVLNMVHALQYIIAHPKLLRAQA